MRFRQARHTNQLDPIIHFYTKVIGLEVIGHFENHQGYDGVFIGEKEHAWDKSSWHLEFTVSWIQPMHQPDEDDLLVFYPETEKEFTLIQQRIVNANIKPIQPKNSYWKRNGITILDPDNYGVVIVNPNALMK